MLSRLDSQRLFGWLTVVLMPAALYTGLVLAPADQLMGDVQRIMYLHVPMAWVGMLAFSIVFVSSIAYLVSKNEIWDGWAVSAAELGVLFMTTALVMGSIWGRSTWGVWWTWDPRLTATAVLLMIYFGYLAVRSFTDDPGRRARWCATIGIIGFLDVPLVYMSVLWWRTLHQQPSSPETVAPIMLAALWTGVIAFTVLFAYLFTARSRLAFMEAALELKELNDE